MKFPQGEGSAVIQRKKNRPVLQRPDVFDCLFSVLYILGNLLNSSYTRFLVAPFFSKPFFLGLFVRFLSTQLFLLVVANILLLSMSAFCYVRLLSLFWVWPFHAVFLRHLPPNSFLEGLSSEQFVEFESVQLLAFLARACCLALLSLGVSFLAICRAVMMYLVLFFGFILRPFYI